MKRLTMFIKNSLVQIRNIKFEIRYKSSLRGTKQSLFMNGLRLPRFARNDVIYEMRSAEYEVRNVNEIRNDSSLRGTKQSLQLFFLRLPRFARNEVTVQHLKFKIQNPKFLFILHTLSFIFLSS